MILVAYRRDVDVAFVVHLFLIGAAQSLRRSIVVLLLLPEHLPRAATQPTGRHRMVHLLTRLLLYFRLLCLEI